MGKVTPYQQSELASQLVGVPQQDNSALQIANAMTNSAGALGNAVSQANAQNQADMQNFQNQAMTDLKSEIGAHRAAKNYLDKQLAQANRDVLVSNTVTAATNDYTGIRADIEEKFAQDPESAMEAYEVKHKERANFYADRIKDPLARAKFIVDSNNTLQQQTTSLTSWAKTQTTNININEAEANVLNTASVLKSTIQTGDTKTLGEKLTEFETKNINSYNKIYGGRAMDQMQAAHTNIIYDVLSVWSANKPGIVREIINKGDMGPGVPEKLLNELVGRDDSNFNAARSIKVSKLHETNANTSAQIRDIEANGARLTKENIHQAPVLIRQLTDLYTAEQNKPVEDRDKDLENQMLSAMWKIGGRNQTVKSAMGTELKENAMFQQAQIQFERSEESYQKSQNSDAVQKRQGGAEAITEVGEISAAIEVLKAKMNSDVNVEKAIKSGAINPAEFREIQKRINKAGESQLLSPGKVMELNAKLDKYRKRAYPGPEPKAPFAAFVDNWLGRSLEGPSDRLLQMMHIPERSGPRYLALKDAIDREIDVIYDKDKAAGIPWETRLSPAQKDLLYQKASMQVFDKMSKNGEMQEVFETIVDVKKKPPLMGPGDIKSQVEAKANKGGGKEVPKPAAKKAATASRGKRMVNPPGFNSKTTPNNIQVPPPPPSAYGTGDIILSDR